MIVPELFMHKTSWGDTGDWTVRGMLGAQEQWSRTITVDDTWVGVQDGAGRPIDQLLFPSPGLWNHVDDMTVTVVPEPGTLVVVGVVALAALFRRHRPR